MVNQRGIGDFRGWKAILWLVSLNVVIRAIWLLVMHPHQQFDFDWYYTHAVQMYEGHGYRIGANYTAYWPMGYPFFLSVLFHVTGPSVIAGLVANALLSLGIVLLVYLLAFRITGLHKFAWIAGVAYTLLPSQVEWNSVLGSEELFTFLLLLSLNLYLHTHRRRWPMWTLLAGFTMGVACMVRPLPLLFPLAILVYEGFVLKRDWVRAIVQSALFGVACMIGLCPLTIRNFVVMHHFILTSTNGGVNLWQGTKASGSYFWSWSPHVNPLLAAGSNEILENQMGVHAFFQYVLHHPWAAFLNGLKKIFFLYWVDWNVVGVTFQALTPPVSKVGVVIAMWVDTVAYWVWMGFVIVGMTRVFRMGINRWRRLGLPLAYILYNTGLFLVFPAWDRFRYPLMPLFALFFAWGWGKAQMHSMNGQATDV
jgi:hypothetical protein